MLEGANEVCIVGIGARTPLGLSAPASSAAVRAGISAVREHPLFVDKAGDPVMVTMDAQLTGDVGGSERFAALAAPALEEALAPLRMARVTGKRIDLLLGMPEQRPGLPAFLATQLRDKLQRVESSQPIHVSMMTSGHCAGLMALEQAATHIRAGASEFCLIGGLDSYLEPETLEWLDEERRLMSRQNRSGFIPGEGAAFCLLTSAATARRHGFEVLGSVVSVATATEENTRASDRVCTGKGLTAAISKATASLSLPDERVNFTYCDLNGERYRNEESTFALLRTQAAFINALDNLTPADCWGDMGAASGALFAVLAVASGQRGYAPGPHLLLWTSSEDGHRSAAVLRVPYEPN